MYILISLCAHTVKKNREKIKKCEKRFGIYNKRNYLCADQLVHVMGLVGLKEIIKDVYRRFLPYVELRTLNSQEEEAKVTFTRGVLYTVYTLCYPLWWVHSLYIRYNLLTWANWSLIFWEGQVRRPNVERCESTDTHVSLYRLTNFFSLGC